MQRECAVSRSWLARQVGALGRRRRQRAACGALSAGAWCRPESAGGDRDRYPLHWASAFGDFDECAELLLQVGARTDVRDAQGRTPYEFATSAGVLSAFLATFGLLGGARPKVAALLQAAAGTRELVGEPAADVAREAASAATRAAAAVWRATPWSAERAACAMEEGFWEARRSRHPLPG